MKVTKCDRCGKEFNGINNVLFCDDGMSIMFPIEMRFNMNNCNQPFIADISEPTSIDICDDCQKSLRDWLDEFKNGGGSMDA